jgi:hypothetical protein
MRPPIIAAADGDVDIFESVEEAERYFELPSVVDRPLVAYDCEGRLLEIGPSAQDRKLLGIRFRTWEPRAKITMVEVEPSHQRELAELLRDFLVRLGASPESLRDTALADLLAVAVERLGAPSRTRPSPARGIAIAA